MGIKWFSELISIECLTRTLIDKFGPMKLGPIFDTCYTRGNRESYMIFTTDRKKMKKNKETSPNVIYDLVKWYYCHIRFPSQVSSTKKIQRWFKNSNLKEKYTKNQTLIKSRATSKLNYVLMKNCVIWYMILSKKWKHISSVPMGGLTTSAKADLMWHVLRDELILILNYLVIRTWNSETFYFREQG